MESPEKRSRSMRAVRQKDTAPELRLRRALHAAGARYRHERRDRPSTVEPQHEGDVLENDERRAVVVDEAKHLADEAGSLAGDAAREAGLAEILTGKSCRNDLNVAWQGAEARDVVMLGDIGEPVVEDRAGRGSDFAEELGGMPRTGECHFETTDSCEKTCDFHPSLHSGTFREHASGQRAHVHYILAV